MNVVLPQKMINIIMKEEDKREPIMSNTSAQPIFLSAGVEMQRIFKLLQNDDINGIYKTDLTNSDKLNIYDMPFANFLTQNFQKFDTNNDNKITTEEFSKMSQDIQNNGMTYEQLVYLSSQTSLFNSDSNQELLNTVLENFKKIDTNGDGKVSAKEISAFTTDKEIDEKKEELTEIQATDMSVFYVDQPETTTEDDNDE